MIVSGRFGDGRRLVVLFLWSRVLLTKICEQEKKKKGKKSKKGEKGTDAANTTATTVTATSSGSGEVSRRHAHAAPRVEEVEDE